MNNLIKELIKKNDLKVKNVIADSGLSRAAFYLIVKGESIPSLTNARKISNALGASLDEVFPEQDFLCE